MDKKLLAVLLALVIAVPLCVSALAEPQPAAAQTEAAGGEAASENAPGEPSPGEGETGEAAPGGEETPEGEAVPGGEEAPEESLPSPAGPDLAENVLREPDAVGYVSFANMESRMRENNLQVLILQQSIDTVEDIDYEDLYEDLRLQLNQLAKAQWNLVLMGDYFMGPYEKDKTIDQMSQAYDAVRDQFEAIKDGEMQQDNADLVRQLKNLQDQILMAGESLYTALTSMEYQKAGLDRQLAALDRTVQEMELRYDLGQISALQLTQVRTGRTSLLSGMTTLAMNVENYKRQLETLIGAEQTGAITLGEVPAVTDSQLEEMDLEADLEAAKAVSYELYDAKLTLEDARDDFKSNANLHGYDPEDRGFRSAKRTWDAAQYTYNDTVQNYELKFRTLYAQVGDCRQILDAAKVSLESQKASCQSAELKYQQGTISKNALLDAQDELSEAEDAVRSASNELFSTYNTYCWAVQHGILN